MSKRESYPKPSDGMRVAIYARKSDLTSESKGKSVDSQIDCCKLAANALGLTVDERLIYREEDGCKGYWPFRGAQGKDEDQDSGPFREEFSKLVREVEAGNVDIVMCWRPDRAYRCDIVAGAFLRKLLTHGVRFFALTQDLYLHTATGFESAISGANSARAYSDKVSEDVKRQLLTNAKNGLLTRKPTQLGFVSAGFATGKALPVMEQVDVVRLVFSWFVNGPEGEEPMSATAIGKRLQKEGIRISYGMRTKKEVDRTRVETSQILTILRNQTYHGYIEHAGEVYPTKCFHFPDESGELQTVISEDIWQRAQAKLNRDVRFPRGKGKRLVCGVTVCASCGRKTYAKSRSAYEKQIRCDRRGRGGDCNGDSYRTFNARDVEAWLHLHLAPLVAAEIVAIKSERSGEPLRRELVITEAQVRKLQDVETESLTKMIISGMDSTQIALVGAKLKAERVLLEKRVLDLRRLLQKEEAPTEMNPLDLVGADESIVRQALVRSVFFITITQSGLIVATKEGSVIGARFGPGDKNPTGGHRIDKILPPTVEASQDALNWLDNPVQFIEGLRAASAWNMKPLTDEQIAPRALLDLASNFVPRPEGYLTKPRPKARPAVLPRYKQVTAHAA